MNQIAIHVLGGLEVRLAGAGMPLDLPTRKSRAFLAYVALSPGMTRSREHLAGMFWDRSAEEQARGSLRQTLSSLRRALPGASAPINTDADSVWLDAGAVEVDALQFERLAAEGAGDSLRKLPRQTDSSEVELSAVNNRSRNTLGGIPLSESCGLRSL